MAMLNFDRGLGTELQRRGIARHTQWGAYGIVVSPMNACRFGSNRVTELSRPYNIGLCPF